MIASGTFGRDGYGAGLPPGMDYQELGALVAKTATPHLRGGNPRPASPTAPAGFSTPSGSRTPASMPSFATTRLDGPRGARPSSSASLWERVEEFAALAAAAARHSGRRRARGQRQLPHVEGGLEFGQSPDLTEEVTRRVREAASLPVIVKLSPNVTDIVPIAQAAARGGAHALTLVNTLSGMVMDRRRPGPLLGAGAGGVSGPPSNPWRWPWSTECTKPLTCRSSASAASPRRRTPWTSSWPGRVPCRWARPATRVRGRRSTSCEDWNDTFAAAETSPPWSAPPTRTAAALRRQQEAPPSQTRRGFACSSLCSWRRP